MKSKIFYLLHLVRLYGGIRLIIAGSRLLWLRSAHDEPAARLAEGRRRRHIRQIAVARLKDNNFDLQFLLILMILNCQLSTITEPKQKTLQSLDTKHIKP